MFKRVLTVMIIALVAAVLTLVIPLDHNNAPHSSDPMTDAFIGTAHAQSQVRNDSDAGRASVYFATTTGAGAMDLQPAAGTGVKQYLYWAQCINSSASTVSVLLLKDGSTTKAVIPCPAGGVDTQPTYFNPPIDWSANVKITGTMSAAITTAYFQTGARTAR